MYFSHPRSAGAFTPQGQHPCRQTSRWLAAFDWQGWLWDRTGIGLGWLWDSCGGAVNTVTSRGSGRDHTPSSQAMNRTTPGAKSVKVGHVSSPAGGPDRVGALPLPSEPTPSPGSENVRATRAALAAGWGWFESGLAGRGGGAHLGRATSGLRSELGGWRSERAESGPG